MPSRWSASPPPSRSSDGVIARRAPGARRRRAQTVAGASKRSALLRGATGEREHLRSRGGRRARRAPGGFAHNDFKIELARRTIVSVLGDLTGQGSAR